MKEEVKKLEQRIGGIGGKITLSQKIITIALAVCVVSLFFLSLLTEGKLRTAAIEIGLLLLSLKFAHFLYNEAKVIHYQFWILKSIEGQLLQLTREIREIKNQQKVSLPLEGKNICLQQNQSMKEVFKT
jgi:hypothetical protein